MRDSPGVTDKRRLPFVGIIGYMMGSSFHPCVVQYFGCCRLILYLNVIVFVSNCCGDLICSQCTNLRWENSPVDRPGVRVPGLEIPWNPVCDKQTLLPEVVTSAKTVVDDPLFRKTLVTTSRMGQTTVYMDKGTALGKRDNFPRGSTVYILETVSFS